MTFLETIPIVISTISLGISAYTVMREKRNVERNVQQKISNSLEEDLRTRLNAMIARNPNEMLLRSELMNRHFADKYNNTVKKDL